VELVPEEDESEYDELWEDDWEEEVRREEVRVVWSTSASLSTVMSASQLTKATVLVWVVVSVELDSRPTPARSRLQIQSWFLQSPMLKVVLCGASLLSIGVVVFTTSTSRTASPVLAP
jgi:hypothetical protein